MAKISFLISTYCGSRWLDRCLYNLTEQTEQDYEAIVVNPNSPENDGEIAQDWAAKDKRVKYIYVPYRETYGSSWLRTWQVAEGEIVVNKNVDDLIDPRYGETVLKYAQGTSWHDTPRHIFWYTGLNIVNEYGQLLSQVIKPPFDKEVYSYQCMGGPVLAWRNDIAIQDYGLLRHRDLIRKRAEEYVSAFDYWLILFFLSKDWLGFSIPEILVTYTQRPDSIEHVNYGTVSTYESLAAISEFFPHHFNVGECQTLGGRLSLEYPEFADFNNLPPKEEWVRCRKEGKTWTK